jgi:hypothetical protein
LQHLSLKGNLIAQIPNYSAIIAFLLPRIRSIDGKSIDNEATKKVSNGMILEAASLMSVMNEELEDEKRVEESIFLDSTVAKNSSSKSEFDDINQSLIFTNLFNFRGAACGRQWQRIDSWR